MNPGPSLEGLRLASDSTDSPHAAPRSFRASGRSESRDLHSLLMSRIDGIRSAFPLRLAQAYEPERTQRPRAAERVQDSVPSVSSISQVTSARVAKRSEAISSLVAGRVDVPVSFQGDALSTSRARATGDTLSLHALPADRNTAATGVSVGRMLDVTA